MDSCAGPSVVCIAEEEEELAEADSEAACCASPVASPTRSVVSVISDRPFHLLRAIYLLGPRNKLRVPQQPGHRAIPWGVRGHFQLPHPRFMMVQDLLLLLALLLICLL